MMQLTREWFIWSKSTLNVYYTVTRDSAGSFSCSCPDFTYRRNLCKHIQKVKMQLAGEAQRNKLPGAEQ